MVQEAHTIRPFISISSPPPSLHPTPPDTQVPLLNLQRDKPVRAEPFRSVLILSGLAWPADLSSCQLFLVIQVSTQVSSFRRGHPDPLSLIKTLGTLLQSLCCFLYNIHHSLIYLVSFCLHLLLIFLALFALGCRASNRTQQSRHFRMSHRMSECCLFTMTNLLLKNWTHSGHSFIHSFFHLFHQFPECLLTAGLRAGCCRCGPEDSVPSLGNYREENRYGSVAGRGFSLGSTRSGLRTASILQEHGEWVLTVPDGMVKALQRN